MRKWALPPQSWIRTPQPGRCAKSSTSTWMPFMPRWSSAMTLNSWASQLLWEDRASAAWWWLRVTTRVNSVSILRANFADGSKQTVNSSGVGCDEQQYSCEELQPVTRPLVQRGKFGSNPAESAFRNLNRFRKLLLSKGRRYEFERYRVLHEAFDTVYPIW